MKKPPHPTKPNVKYRFPQACVIIMAKAPVAGQVKTRLIPAVGERSALNLYRSMLISTATQMLYAQISPVEIWCHPDTSHADFLHFEKKGATLNKQTGCDLGERMNYALTRALLSYEWAVIVGCDCPEMTPNIINTALEVLSEENQDAVLGPAEDGGYYLLGIKQPAASLFKNIDWGKPEVLENTRQALQTLDWKWRELDTLWDLDRPEDLIRYQNSEITP